MRLNAEQVEAIKLEAGLCSGAQAKGWLFASYKGVQRGFTMVELIMTMVVIGIIAVVAAPRFFDNDVFQSRGAADQVKAALRYGQKIAVAQRKNVAVNITSPTAASDCGTALNVSGNIDCRISNRVTVPSKTVTFNALGQPVPNGADSITVGAAPNTTVITIEAETGYVH